MNKRTVYKNPRTGEQVVRIDHASGLPIYVWPKAGYQSCYALFGTNYGSIDTAFSVDGRAVEVPAGIAHYLEHKLFENEDCDAFVKYAKTGANANAYTTFDRTAYLFSCTGEITPSLEILLDFVQKPYFTAENVEKERGIIGQEIRMYDDSPGWRVFGNLLSAMYSRHPVRVNIAGTVESIAKITPELLYDCYRTFYNLHNMVLSVCGNVTPEEVEAVADRLLPPAPAWDFARADANEPEEVATPRVEERMAVAAPLFYYAYKLPVHGMNRIPTRKAMAANVVQEIVAGRASPLYTRLMAQGLINQSFGMELFDGPGYAALLFGGESRDPDAVAAAIREEAARIAREGIDKEAFEATKRALYGAAVMSLDDVDDCASAVMNAHFCGVGPFDEVETAATLTIEDVQEAAALLRPDRTVLSIIRPLQET